MVQSAAAVLMEVYILTVSAVKSCDDGGSARLITLSFNSLELWRYATWACATICNLSSTQMPIACNRLPEQEMSPQGLS